MQDPFLSLAAQIAQWRQNKRWRGEPMPKSLWRAAVLLARRHGIGKTADILGLAHGKLKQQCLIDSASDIINCGDAGTDAGCTDDSQLGKDSPCDNGAEGALCFVDITQALSAQSMNPSAQDVDTQAQHSGQCSQGGQNNQGDLEVDITNGRGVHLRLRCSGSAILVLSGMTQNSNLADLMRVFCAP